jgi:hypothetical protein
MLAGYALTMAAYGTMAGGMAGITGRDVPDRVPFTAYQGTSGPAELDEEVRGEGVQKAVGELVTCPGRRGSPLPPSLPWPAPTCCSSPAPD